MLKCPVCGAEYEPGDVICRMCGKELPEPYEVVRTRGAANAEEAAGAGGAEEEEAWVKVLELLPDEAKKAAALLDYAHIRYRLEPREGSAEWEALAPAELADEQRSAQVILGGGQMLASGGAPLGVVRLYAPREEAGAAWLAVRGKVLRPGMTALYSGAEVITREGDAREGDTPWSLLPEGTVVVEGGLIVEVLPFATPDPGNGVAWYDLAGFILGPGLIDLHTHGFLGVDVNSAGSDAFVRLAAQAPRFGITGLCPTATACTPEELSTILECYHAAAAERPAGARLLGLHWESSFVNPHYAGALPADRLYTADSPAGVVALRALQRYSSDVRIVTLAAEMSGATAAIAALRRQGIHVSLGHSGADYEAAIAGFDAGATMVTHLFNAMVRLHHREPGLVGAALERDDVYVTLICDGTHVHPAVLSTVISAKGAERTVVISDAMAAAGLDDGAYTLGGMAVTVKDGVATTAEGRLAGSTALPDAGVRTLVNAVGWDLGEAMEMASGSAAAAAGLPTLGAIAPGYPADMVIWDADLEPVVTYVAGVEVYARG